MILSTHVSLFIRWLPLESGDDDSRMTHRMSLDVAGADITIQSSQKFTCSQEVATMHSYRALGFSPVFHHDGRC